MEYLLGIVIFILCVVIWVMWQVFKIEKENTEYYRSENKRVQNENYALMRELINKE